ncbi:Speckle-type POZ protein B [Aphelenchoides fujianensis]|nr:Speckle-type POZ protein B [Aphelenchoides fujianensis]
MAAAMETIFRWPLDDFKNRFQTVGFQHEWVSPDFEIVGVPGAKFYLSFYPKGEKDEHPNKCAMFLSVRDFHDHPFIRLKYEVSFENGIQKQLKKEEDDYEFHPASDNWGWPDMFTQTELAEFAESGPLVVFCKVTPLDLIAHTDDSAPSDVLAKIAANFNSDKLADVEVRVQEKIFKVSKAIICSGSPVFDRMFTTDTKERETGVVEIKKEDADMIELLLRYLYSGKVEGLKDVADRLLPVADCYEVLHLSAMCLESLYKNVSAETILRDLKLSYAHDHAGYFKKKLLQFAQKNFKIVREQDDWTPEFVESNSQIVMEIMALLTI